MHPVLRTLFAGVYDEECILNCLLGKPHLIQLIWSFFTAWYYSHIHLPVKKKTLRRAFRKKIINDKIDTIDTPGVLFCQELDEVTFPEPKDLNINMMPFKSARSFEESGLPLEVKPYWRFISKVQENCGVSLSPVPPWSRNEKKIWYLTIQENWVEAGESQRRPGLHTDNTGPLRIQSDKRLFERKLGSGVGSLQFYEHFWGGGVVTSREIVKGGICMASNVAESCEVWNCKVDTEIIGDMGDLEHIKCFLTRKKVKKEKLKYNTLYWITDKTPHESLPLKERTYRQFFRVVTEDVSLWFVDHSTPNPNGIKPNPKITKIVKGNKFDPSSLVVIEDDLAVIKVGGVDRKVRMKGNSKSGDFSKLHKFWDKV